MVAAIYVRLMGNGGLVGSLICLLCVDRPLRISNFQLRLSASVCDSIAKELVQFAQLAPGDLVLEVGAGTGQIGLALCQLQLRYVGFDASAAMLDVFRHRYRKSRQPASLIATDGNNRWPV